MTRDVALVPRTVALAFALSAAFGYSCGNPVPLEQRDCPCLDQAGYVCCEATGKCQLVGATCPPSAAPDAAVDRPDSGNTGGADAPGGSGGGGSGGTDGGGSGGTGGGGTGGGKTDVRPVLDSATVNELTVDRWSAISRVNAPSGRTAAAAVWTGKEMIIWGGTEDQAPLATGARYNPETDRWTTMTTLRAPLARVYHSAVWTGKEMIVWGGHDSNHVPLDSGGRYDPESDSWSATSRTGAGPGREGHLAVWSGAQMLVWSGRNGEVATTGLRYDPSTDTWSAMSADAAATAMDASRGIWTGRELLLYGGHQNGAVHGPLGLYRPATDLWQSFPANDAPRNRYGHVLVWTGTEAIVWGGTEYFDPGQIKWDGAVVIDTRHRGGAFDVAGGTWRLISPTDQPATHHAAQAVFATGAGTRATGFMLVAEPEGFQGGAYDPASDQWFPLSMQDSPRFMEAFAFWTGREMLVWGHDVEDSRIVNAGGRYQP